MIRNFKIMSLCFPFNFQFFNYKIEFILIIKKFLDGLT